MRLSFPTLALLACCLAPTSACAQDAPAKKKVNEKLHAPLTLVVGEKGAVKVPALASLWGTATGRRASVTSSLTLRTIRIQKGTHTLSRTELATILGQNEIAIVEDERQILLVEERALQTKTQGTAAAQYEGDAPLPRLHTQITWACTIKHGAASAIYATLRGLLSRDPTRNGNILYIQGPQKIVITDLAPKVSYYRNLIRQLDLPLRSQFVTLYRVSSASWDAIKLKPTPELRKNLAQLLAEKKITRLEEVRSTGTNLTLKQNVEVGGRVSLLKLEMVTIDNGVSGGSFRIKASIVEHQGNDSHQAEVDFVSHRTGPGSVTSVAFKGGEDRLVVVVTKIGN